MHPSTPFETAAPTAAGYRDLSPAVLHAVLGTVRVVDVRESDELTGDLGRIAGIEHAPLATLPAGAAGWPRDQPIVLVCRSGGRSSRAARVLVAAGFERVLNLAGGMIAYRAAGL